MPRKQLSLPPSATRQSTAIMGLIGFFLSLAALSFADVSATTSTILAMAATAIPMMAHELIVLKIYNAPSTGLTVHRTTTNTPKNWRRIFAKLVGLWGTLLIISLIYWAFPEYRGDFYDPFQNACVKYLPIFIILAIPYFIYVDSWMDAPEDGYWHAGNIFLANFDLVDWSQVKSYALGWLIKGFFLPLMFTYLLGNVEYLTSTSPAVMFQSTSSLVNYFSYAVFSVDLVFISVGYLLTLRLTNSHIQSPHPYFWGWAVTLILYAPFNHMLSTLYLDYDDNIFWLDMLGPGQGVVVAIWAIAIIILWLIYMWSSVSFGLRFSNLTHRGIITNGTYRWSRHPAYVTKNLTWWLISVPFFSMEGPETAIRHSILLLGVNFLYFLRAKAEEKHLSEDPVYVEYALWMEDHGKLRWIRKIFPFVAYTPPKNVAHM